MRILVTGGAGFIGSSIVQKYIEQGHEVAIIDNFITGLKENINPSAKFYEVDITDKDATAKAILDFQPEVINHQAAHLSVYQSVENPQFDATANVLGLLNILEPAVKVGLKRIVVASSGGVMYGDTDVIPTPEDHPAKPISPYGVTKMVTEAYLHYYQVQHGIDWVALRYANVYGPKQNPKGETGVIAVFLEKMANGNQPVIFGDGMQTRDYVFIDDVVDANLLATNKGAGAYNIATGIETNVVQIFDYLQAALGTDFTKEFGDAREGEQQRSALAIDKAKIELSWEPKVMLEEGVKETVDWYQAKNR